jgi:hypothetical protein
MLNSMKLRGLALAFVAVACMVCAPQAQARTKAPRNSDRSYGIMYDVYTGFDDSGRILPDTGISPTQAIMLGEIEKHCATKAEEVRGQAQFMLKTGFKGGIINAIFTAAGAVLGFPGTRFGDYAAYAGVAGIGSGLFAGNMTEEQAMKVVSSYCVLQWVQKNSSDRNDRRLDNIIAIPLMVGNAPRPQVNQSLVTERRDAHDGDEDVGNAPLPPPMH